MKKVLKPRCQYKCRADTPEHAESITDQIKDLNPRWIHVPKCVFFGHAICSQNLMCWQKWFNLLFRIPANRNFETTKDLDEMSNM